MYNKVDKNPRQWVFKQLKNSHCVRIMLELVMLSSILKVDIIYSFLLSKV